MLGTLNHQSVCLPLLESCLELSTISGFAFAGVMLGTLNHQWVYLCWSHAWNSRPSVGLPSQLGTLNHQLFTFAGVMLGTLNHQWVYLCWSHAWNSQPSVGLPLLESCLELLTISVFAFAKSCLELLTISGFTFAGVMLGTLFNHQWVYLCWSHAWNS